MAPPAKRARAAEAETYPIGRPGAPWSDAERRRWQTLVTQGGPRRSYARDVKERLEALSDAFEVEQYGELGYTINGAAYTYPLFVAKTPNFDPAKPNALITGGVHGYETSGVMGALMFLEQEAQRYSAHFNVVVAPCVAPWGYEFVQRWNAEGEDPNRSFKVGQLSQESTALRAMVAKLGIGEWRVHVDLHETTDTDKTEFRPALAARDGMPFKAGDIPDGFYIIGDSGHADQAAQIEFNRAVIAGVSRVTHIAPPDAEGKIVGKDVADVGKGGDGVIRIDKLVVGTCCNGTIPDSRASYAATTEVYPDSPETNDDECSRAQVAAVCAALDFALKH